MTSWTSFPQARLDQRENFLSLMHYFGLLSIRQVVAGVPRLGIPKQTVRQLMYGYLRDAYRDVGAFSLDLVEFDRLTRQMALDASGGRPSSACARLTQPAEAASPTLLPSRNPRQRATRVGAGRRSASPNCAATRLR